MGKLQKSSSAGKLAASPGHRRTISCPAIVPRLDLGRVLPPEEPDDPPFAAWGQCVEQNEQMAAEPGALCFSFGPGPIGLALQQRGQAVVVSDVGPGSTAALAGVPVGARVRSVAGLDVGRLPKAEVTRLLASAARPVQLGVSITPAQPASQPAGREAGRTSPCKQLFAEQSPTGQAASSSDTSLSATVALRLSPGQLRQLNRTESELSLDRSFTSMDSDSPPGFSDLEEAKMLEIEAELAAIRRVKGNLPGLEAQLEEVAGARREAKEVQQELDAELAQLRPGSGRRNRGVSWGDQAAPAEQAAELAALQQRAELAEAALAGEREADRANADRLDEMEQANTSEAERLGRRVLELEAGLLGLQSVAEQMESAHRLEKLEQADAHAEELALLRAAVQTDARRELTEALAAREELQARLDSTVAVSEELRNERSALERQLADERRDWAGRVEQLEGRVASQSREHAAALQGQMGQDMLLAELEEQRQSDAARISSLGRELASAQAECEEGRGERARLKAELAATRVKLDELEAEVEQKKRGPGSKQRQADAARISALERELKAEQDRGPDPETVRLEAEVEAQAAELVKVKQLLEKVWQVGEAAKAQAAEKAAELEELRDLNGAKADQAGEEGRRAVRAARESAVRAERAREELERELLNVREAHAEEVASLERLQRGVEQEREAARAEARNERVAMEEQLSLTNAKHAAELAALRVPLENECAALQAMRAKARVSRTPSNVARTSPPVGRIDGDSREVEQAARARAALQKKLAALENGGNAEQEFDGAIGGALAVDPLSMGRRDERHHTAPVHLSGDQPSSSHFDTIDSAVRRLLNRTTWEV